MLLVFAPSITPCRKEGFTESFFFPLVNSFLIERIENKISISIMQNTLTYDYVL